MGRIERLLKRLDGLTVSDALILIGALNCQHDEISAPLSCSQPGWFDLTTPFELHLSHAGATLAITCPVWFQGGPPTKWGWYQGTLLSFTADRLLQRDADLPENQSIKLKGTCPPHKPRCEHTEVSSWLGRAHSPADDDETVYLWSSSGRTAVRGNAL